MHVVTDSGSGRARECDEQPVAEIQSSLTTGILKNHRNDAEVRGLCYGVKREAASRSGTSQNPQNTNTKSNTNPKTQITCSNSVRGRLLGYAQNRSRRTKYLRFVNRLIELQF